MGYSNDGIDDLEKLRRAFADIIQKFGSVDDILEAFGLAGMPQAQRYGIMFGCLVFALTVTTVIALLILGGSFKRIAEQAQTGEATLLSAHDARSQRALLLDRLLESRERLAQNYPAPSTTEGLTNLTKTLLNVAPGPMTQDLAELVTDDQTNNKEAKKQEIRRYIPPHYEENYISAYRKCQDKPGGPTLSGRPEARFEAYARAFAGCGPHTSLTYRRSYARMYESICCHSHTTDDRYLELFKQRPEDLVGRYVRLEALEVDRHLQPLYDVTCGEALFENKSFNPDEIWAFREDGPFQDAKAMRNSFVFMHLMNEAAFAVVNSLTDRVIGVIHLTHDDPKHLTIQLELPIMPPHKDGSGEQMECCFLLMDRIFAYGYRRVQVSIDSQDVLMRKLVARLGFTMEGVLYKHMVVKEANRDSAIYGMLNSDWKRGARGSLFKKLYGVTAQRIDTSNEKSEEELDEQQRVLEERKQAEAKVKLA